MPFSLTRFVYWLLYCVKSQLQFFQAGRHLANSCEIYYGEAQNHDQVYLTEARTPDLARAAIAPHNSTRR